MSQDANQPTASGIGTLINDKLAPSAPAQVKKDEKKFIIMITSTSDRQLDVLAHFTGTGKIKLASELFAIGIKDAMKQLKTAGKVDNDGNPLDDSGKVMSLPAWDKKAEKAASNGEAAPAAPAAAKPAAGAPPTPAAAGAAPVPPTPGK